MARLQHSFEDLKRLMEAFPSTLVVMFYDAAIDNLEAAAEAAEQGDIAARYSATERAADLVDELRLALDFTHGGKIAEQLDGLYGFIIAQLPQVNLGNDALLARRLAELLRPLRESWADLDQRLRAEDSDRGGGPAQDVADTEPLRRSAAG